MMMDSNARLRERQRKLGYRRSGRTAGFSMLEMLVVLIIIAILVVISIPKLARVMSHERVNRAAQVVVADLQNGFAMAGRQRAPVRLTFTSSTKTYVFTDRATGTVLQTRSMNNGSEYSLSKLDATPTVVDVLPNGIGSASFSVTV